MSRAYQGRDRGASVRAVRRHRRAAGRAAGRHVRSSRTPRVRRVPPTRACTPAVWVWRRRFRSIRASRSPPAKAAWSRPTTTRLAEVANMLRNHGASISEEQRHDGPRPYLLPEFNLLGFNYRMTDLQGAVGRRAARQARPVHRRTRRVGGVVHARARGRFRGCACRSVRRWQACLAGLCHLRRPRQAPHAAQRDHGAVCSARASARGRARMRCTCSATTAIDSGCKAR